MKAIQTTGTPPAIANPDVLQNYAEQVQHDLIATANGNADAVKWVVAHKVSALGLLEFFVSATIAQYILKAARIIPSLLGIEFVGIQRTNTQQRVHMLVRVTNPFAGITAATVELPKLFVQNLFRPDVYYFGAIKNAGTYIRFRAPEGFETENSWVRDFATMLFTSIFDTNGLVNKTRTNILLLVTPAGISLKGYLWNGAYGFKPVTLPKEINGQPTEGSIAGTTLIVCRYAGDEKTTTIYRATVQDVMAYLSGKTNAIYWQKGLDINGPVMHLSAPIGDLPENFANAETAYYQVIATLQDGSLRVIAVTQKGEDIGFAMNPTPINVPQLRLATRISQRGFMAFDNNGGIYAGVFTPKTQADPKTQIAIDELIAAQAQGAKTAQQSVSLS